jgi:hypothetical protein
VAPQQRQQPRLLLLRGAVPALEVSVTNVAELLHMHMHRQNTLFASTSMLPETMLPDTRHNEHVDA